MFRTISPIGSMNPSMMVLILLIMIAVTILKGYALWTAAKRGENIWFIVLLAINTLGILELVYLFALGKAKRNTSNR